MFHPKVTKVQKVKVSDSEIEADPVENHRKTLQRNRVGSGM